MNNKFAFILLAMLSIASMVTIVDSKRGTEILSDSLEPFNEIIFCSMLFYPFTYPTKESEYGRSFVLFSTLPSNNSNLQNGLLKAISNVDIDFTKLMVSNQAHRAPSSPKFTNRIRVYVLVIDNIELIPRTIRSWRLRNSWNPLAIVFSVLNFSATDATIKHIFEIFFANQMVNVYVVFEDEMDFKLASWFPYDNGRCADQVEKITILDECRPNIYNRMTSTDDDKEAPKPTNLLSSYHSCPLNISASVWEPYVAYNVSESTDEKRWTGIEVSILRAVADHLNMTTNFILNTESRSDRGINISRGLYSPLLRNEAQLMIGGLVKDPNVLLAFTESMPYLNDDHAWCIKRASQSASWENIFNVFQLNLWIAFIATFIMISVGLYTFIYIEDVPKNFYWALLRGLSLSLAIPAFLWPTKTFSMRLVFFVFFTYGVIITTGFNCFLVNALTKQRFSRQIDSINETIRHNFYYAGGPVVFDSLATRGDAMSWSIRSRFTLCSDLNKCLMRLKYDHHLAVATSLLHLRSYRPLADVDIYCLAQGYDRIFDYPVTIVAQQNFHLLPTINSLILRLIEHGIISKWHNDNMSFRMRQKSEERRMYDENFANGLPAPNDRAIILTVTHVLGSIVILFIGYCIGAVVFLFEILVGHKMKSIPEPTSHKRTKCERFQHRFWIICHNIVSDERLLKKK